MVDSRNRSKAIFIWPTVLYEAEALTVSQKTQKKLAPTWRRKMKILWKARRTNDEVLEMNGERRCR